MKKQVSLTALALATAMSATAAQASDIEFSGKVFVNYSNTDVTPAGGPTTSTSGTSITRTYITAKKEIDDTWSAKVTLDSAYDQSLAATGTSKANNVFLKTAQLTGKFSDELNVKLGMISTPWIGYEDKLNGHRYITNSYADSKGFDHSADAGVGVFGKALDGLINYDVVLVNGQGYSNTAVAESSDLNFRVGSDALPVEGLTVDFGYRTGFMGTEGQGIGAETESTLTQIMATFGQEADGIDYRAGFNIITNDVTPLGQATATTDGLELWLRARKDDLGGFFRYESTDIGAGAATEKRMLLSADYYAAKGVTFSAVYDSTSDVAGIAGDDKSTMGIFSQFTF